MKLKDINVDKVARAVEADAGRPLGSLRASLRQAKAGKYARTTHVKLTPATRARIEVGASQSQFATLLGVSARTVQDWEQGRRQPTGAAKTLLRVATKHPEVLRELERYAEA